MAVAQPSLSKHIRELERELDTKLFERSHVGIHLTPHGHKLLAESQAILERIDNLRSTVTDEDDVLRGSVRIGAPTAIASLLFGPLAERLRAVHPDLHLSGSSDGSRLMELLEANELDMAILTQVDTRELGAGWTVDVLVREQCFLVGRVGEIDPDRPVKLADVVRLPLILTPWRNSRRRQLEQLAANLGVRMNVVAEAEAMGAVSFARQGTGFGLLPYSSAHLMRSLGPMEIAPIADAWSYRVLARKANRAPSLAQIVVSQFIVRLFEDLSRQDAFGPQRRTPAQATKPAAPVRERVASF
jgi:LysR family nitrogen assimilation transcriptional regulator